MLTDDTQSAPLGQHRPADSLPASGSSWRSNAGAQVRSKRSTEAAQEGGAAQPPEPSGGECNLERLHLSSIHERKASVDSEAEQTLPARLEKYGKAKQYSRYVAEWCRDDDQKRPCNPLGWRLRAKGQLDCASWLDFRKALSGDDTAWKLVDAKFCQQGHTCPLCALRRGAKSVQAVVPRVLTVLAEKPLYEAYMVTLTLTNGPDLGETFDVLDGGLKALVRQCRQAKKNPLESRAMRAVVGGVGHIETKRGKGGQWHPHYHGLWLCDRKRMANPRARWPIDTSILGETWAQVTGGRGRWHHVDKLHSDKLRFSEGFEEALRRDVMEVIKYAVKFEDVRNPKHTEPERDQMCRDLWSTADVLRGRTLLRSFGELHNVEVDDDLTDDPLDWETLEYIEAFFRYRQGEYRETPRPRKVTGRGGNDYPEMEPF